MKKIVPCILIFLFNYNISISQDVLDKEKTFYDAEFLMTYENYSEALPLYLKLIDAGLNNANIHHKTGKAYLNIYGKKKKAVPYLETAIKNISFRYKKESYKEKKAPVEALLLMGEACQINNELLKALDYYHQYKKLIEEKGGNTVEVDRKISNCFNAVTLQENPVDYEIIAVPNINIGSKNYKPALSGNGNRLVFMSRRKYYEAIFFSKKQNGTWTDPENITMEVESDGQFQVASLSFDGSKLLLIHKPTTHYELYESNYSSRRWNKKKSFNKNINSSRDEVHACLTPDGKTLYFVSNRKEGFGGFDIYKSELDNQGEWGPAINMGPVINTAYNENTPFFSSDGKTLYFSSEGHYNIGGYDVFYSNKLANGTWTDPHNLGYPINTTDDDLFYTPLKNKILGYQSRILSDEPEKENIYEIEFFSEINPRKAKIEEIVSLVDHEEITDTSLKISPVSTTTDTIPEPIKTVEEEIFYINTIFFSFDDYSLSKKSTKELDNIYAILEKFQKLNLQIIGNTDSKGSDIYNLSLSEKRAAAALNYLTEKGVEKSRLKPLGKGEKNPVAINQNPDGTDNPEGRRYNRRVVFGVEGLTENNIKIQKPEVPEHLRIK